jgi:sensor domain CHASE-containing protein
MPARLRLPLALLACALVTVAATAALWRLEQDDVRREAAERARTAAAGLEERAGAAVLALQGVRAAYDASGTVDGEAFATHARVPLARPEIVAVGWAPRVAGGRVTYPLLRQEPAGDSPRVLDLGADPSLAEALRTARNTGEPRLSAPIRLERNGGLGFFAFVPVFARDLPLETPAERREALLGVVVGALSANELAAAAFAGLPQGLRVRTTDGPALLSHGPGGLTVARASVGGRTWRVALTPAAPSPLVPAGAAAAVSAVALLILGFALLLRRRDRAEF